MVLADLTSKNPNVFYELAVRHAVQKPVILIGEHGLDTPFDIAAQRLIFYSLDPDDIIEAKKQLSEQIDSVESDNFIVDSPISDEIQLHSPDALSENYQSRRILAILENQSKEISEVDIIKC